MEYRTLLSFAIRITATHISLSTEGAERGATGAVEEIREGLGALEIRVEEV